MIISQDERIFRSNDVNRAAIVDFLNNPAIGQAFAILSQAPQKEPAFMPGVPFDTTLAHEHCKMIGANSILRGLIRMTHPLAQSPEEREALGTEEEPFDYLKDTVQMPKQPVPPPPMPVVETSAPKKRGRPRKNS